MRQRKWRERARGDEEVLEAPRHAPGKGRIYRKAASGAPGKLLATDLLDALLETSRGESLPDALRGVLGDDVRVHTDDAANRAAALLDADAFTIGKDIYFARDRFAPDAPDGRQLIAHEVAHAIRGERASDPDVSSPSDEAEQYADAFAGAFGAGDDLARLGRSAHDRVPVDQQAQRSAQSHAEGGTAVVTRDMFAVEQFSTTGAGSFYREDTGLHLTIRARGVHAHAVVLANTADARSYNVGFVQTLHHARRRAVYATEHDASANHWQVTRDHVMDQRTDIPATPPWYNGFIHAGAAGVSVGMEDHPFARMPLYAPETPTQEVPQLARLEGQESFTTYLVVMRGSDPASIIYLGSVDWGIAWAGRIDDDLEFHGGASHVGPTVLGSRGGAVLGGTSANHGPPGGFTG